ncbi:MAG: antirestriction protein ArdA [Actinomycetota bacterium]|nr:antirestriction protein ArdA [Actinomycetota bacterium]
MPHPRIYVASLADYNAGRLHGAWIDADQEPEQLSDAVQAMLAKSRQPGAEEWAIHDYDGFGAYRLGEYHRLEDVAALAAGISEHGLAFAAWAEQASLDTERLERFDDAYLGHFGSVETYAEDWLDESGANELLDKLPSWLRPYVNLDVAGFARDLQLGGDITCAPDETGVHIFDATI